MKVSLASSPLPSSAKDPLTTDCPGRAVFSQITSRWGLMALLALADGPMRFHVLRDAIDGISEKMLSQTLRMLRRHGLVVRTVEPRVPPHVTYELTTMGDEIAGSLGGIVRWIGSRIEDILEAQRGFDHQATSVSR